MSEILDVLDRIGFRRISDVLRMNPGCWTCLILDEFWIWRMFWIKSDVGQISDVRYLGCQISVCRTNLGCRMNLGCLDKFRMSDEWMSDESWSILAIDLTSKICPTSEICQTSTSRADIQDLNLRIHPTSEIRNIRDLILNIRDFGPI